MKLSTYTPQVNRNTINARVQAPGSLQSYGADQSGAMGTSRMLGGLAQMSQRIMIDDDKRTLLEAMDAYNKGRYNILYGDNGLMKTNLEGAAGISQSYTEQEQKLRSDVLKNINFKTRDYELAFGDMANKSAQQGLELVNKHQYTQGEEVKNVRLNNNLTEYLNFAQQNYNDPGIVAGTAQMAGLLIAARYEGYGDEFIQAKTREAVGNMGGTLVNTAIANDDYTAADSLLNDFDAYITPQQKAAFRQTIYAKQKKEYEYNLARQLYAKHNGDKVAIYDELFGGSYGLPEEGTTWVRSNDTVSLDGAQQKTLGGIAELSAWYKEVAGEPLMVTSGTDSTDLHASGERSHGGGWKADVASDWLENANNRKQFIQKAQSLGVKVLDEYENPSANSTGGHLDLDFTDYNGVAAMDFEDANKVFDMVESIDSNRQAYIKAQQNKYFDTVKKTVVEMFNEGVPYHEAMQQMMKAAGSSYDAIEQMPKIVDTVYKAGNSNTKGISDIGMDWIKERLAGGDFRTKQALAEFAVNKGASLKQINTLEKEYDKWDNGEGEYGYDWTGIKDIVMGNVDVKDDAKDLTWKGIQQSAQQFITKYTVEHGEQPARADVIDYCKQAAKQNYIGYYVEKGDFFGESIRISDAELAIAGIRNVRKQRAGSLLVTFEDGHREMMDLKDLHNYVERYNTTGD